MGVVEIGMSRRNVLDDLVIVLLVVGGRQRRRDWVVKGVMMDDFVND